LDPRQKQQEAQIIGLMQVGSHFGNDIGNKFNYNSKRICHMVSRQPSVIGVISKENLAMLYNSFPEWKDKI